MPIASTLEPLTDSQVAAYRRLPGDFGTMLQVCFNDGWNGCHAHMTEEIVKLDARVEELEAFLAGLLPRRELDQHRELRQEIETILNC